MVKSKNRTHEEKVPNKKRRRGDLRVHDGLSRMQSRERRDDSDEPLGGVPQRITEHVEKVGDERLEREAERLIEHLEEKESRKKKAKTSESNGE